MSIALYMLAYTLMGFLVWGFIESQFEGKSAGEFVFAVLATALLWPFLVCIEIGAALRRMIASGK